MLVKSPFDALWKVKVIMRLILELLMVKFWYTGVNIVKTKESFRLLQKMRKISLELVMCYEGEL
jgi:hypothetical protein